MLYGIDSNSPTATMVGAISALQTTDVPEWVWKTAAGQTAADKISFVLRYLTNHGNANLNVAEVLKLTDAGLKIVSIFEAGASLAILTEATGYANGKSAFAAAARVSQKLGTPIYFAIDFSPTMAELPKVTDYFDGVRRALDEVNTAAGSTTDTFAIGVYGQPHVCTHCRDTDATKSAGTKLASYFWRWGGRGAWPGANVQQLYGPNVYGASSATGKDKSLHFINAAGQIVGEKFCGLSVDFNISEQATVEAVGAWDIPVDATTTASADDGDQPDAPSASNVRGTDDDAEPPSDDSQAA